MKNWVLLFSNSVPLGLNVPSDQGQALDFEVFKVNCILTIAIC
jgi:hypothetical protein